MPPKIIVSYDGTDNDDDALALARLLASAGASLELAYVRHARERAPGREHELQQEADELLGRGARWLGREDVPTHVVFSASTPEGLAELAAKEQADVVVFGSEYRTAPDHVQPQASAQRLLDGGQFAVAIAPAKLHERNFAVETIAPVSEDGDSAAAETAALLAARLGAAVSDRSPRRGDLLVIGSKPGTAIGRVGISASAAYLIETVMCPVLVLPRGTTVDFGGPAPAAVGAGLAAE
jgi:nucleotide-binding universal stress UspA family protein